MKQEFELKITGVHQWGKRLNYAFMLLIFFVIERHDINLKKRNNLIQIMLAQLD